MYSLGHSPINIEQLELSLRHYPNQSEANELIYGFRNGFSIGYEGPRRPVGLQSQIWGEKAAIAREKICKEISLGRIAGPFLSPPFPTFRVSPIAVIPKKSSSEFRLIHNLSFPAGGSVNDCIDDRFCSVKYSSIDDAVNMIHKLGRNALLAKCDIKSAFRLLPLNPSDFDLMGFKFDDLYFYQKVLPMGASSSCALFNKFSSILHWYVEKKSYNDNIIHYLDDFLFGGEAGTTKCQDTLYSFQSICNNWGVPLAKEKTVKPTEVLIFLGILFDTKNMVMRLPDEKLQEVRTRIITCLNSQKVILRELQSLIGVLNFACQVIVPGRAFCRRLVDATCGVSKPHHRIRISSDMKEDLKIWLMFLSKYNGTTVILDQFWSSNSMLHLFCDAAAGEGRGFGVYFNGKWAQAVWPYHFIEKNLLSDITFLELFPVVVAIYIWGEQLKNKKILFHIDNQSVIAILNKKSSRSVTIMILVRKLVLACLHYNILLKAEHISTRLNSIADSLSRCDFQKFRRLCPSADAVPCAIPTHLWNF